MDNLGMALQELFDEQTLEFLQDIDRSEPHIFSQRHDKKMQKLFKRQRKPYFKLISTAGRRAACIALAIVMLSASAMSVKAVRETFFAFVTSVFSDHQVISTDTDSNGGYPKTIEEQYRITSLPDGYKQAYRQSTETMVDIPYYSADSRILFVQHTKDSFSITFTDDAKIEDCTDSDGQKYQVVRAGYESVYIWDNGRYIFEITGSLDRDKMLKICRSVQPVHKAD